MNKQEFRDAIAEKLAGLSKEDIDKAVAFYTEAVNDRMDEGMSEEETLEKKRRQWEGLSIRAHVDLYIRQGMDEKDAMKEAALDRGVSKRDIYRELKV